MRGIPLIGSGVGGAVQDTPELRSCCATRWNEGHRGTCRFSLMRGGTGRDLKRDR